MGNRLRNKLSMAKEQVREAYRNGATLRQIAELHGASPGTVRNVLIEMGETLRHRGRRRKEDLVDARVLSVDSPVVDENCDDCHTNCDDCQDSSSFGVGDYEGGTF